MMSISASKRLVGVCALGCVATALAGVLLVRLASGSLVIDGRATVPITLGLMVPLDPTFINTNDFAIEVTELNVTVRDVSAPNADSTHPCTVGDFAVVQISRSVKITVGARAKSSLSGQHVPTEQWPHVGMLNRAANQDGCRGASLTLDYSATRKFTSL